MGHNGLARRWHDGRRLIHDNGITYNIYDDPQNNARPWQLDPIPLVMDPEEWKSIEAGIIQRATLFNTILADLYGPQRLLREDQLPRELVFPNPAFLRSCWGIVPQGGVFLHVYSADLARSPDGQWWVLADRTQAPSGAGYALENRLVTARVMPDVFRVSHVRRLANYFQAYRNALQRMVPVKRENPRIVVLTPGPYNETYFEHAFLARYLGYTLVEGADLTVRENRVFLKTLGGLLPVDVIVRRQDDHLLRSAGVARRLHAGRSRSGAGGPLGNGVGGQRAGVGAGGVSGLRGFSARLVPATPRRGVENADGGYVVVRPGGAVSLRGGASRRPGDQAHFPRHGRGSHLRRGTE